MFKILALWRMCPFEETIYIDNDIRFNSSAYDQETLVEPFRLMREQNKTVGVALEPNHPDGMPNCGVRSCFLLL